MVGEGGVVGEGERVVRAEEKGGSNRCEDSKTGRKLFGGGGREEEEEGRVSNVLKIEDGDLVPKFWLIQVFF